MKVDENEIEVENQIQKDLKSKTVRKKPKKPSPIVIQELVDETSEEESRIIPPYSQPFWVKFLTELTKQALGALSKVSRLPRRLYFGTDSELDFDDKMKEWFNFNAFNPQPTKGREILDFIALHHKSLTNLEETARGYLKKKKISELVNRCTRITSAEVIADEILIDVIQNALKNQMDDDAVELYVSSVVSSAVSSMRTRNTISGKEEEIEEEGEEKQEEKEEEKRKK